MEYIRGKIDELFEYRQLPALLSTMIQEPSESEKYLERLKHLQFLIYRLDDHLENHWEITDQDLEPYWKEIYEYLQSAFGLNAQESFEYTSQIRKYQRHELQLREGLLPIRFKWKYFYFYKSCDVKLIRKLIYDHPSIDKKYFQSGLWRNFDLITELNDDIDDILEDFESINCNMILLYLESHDVNQVFEMVNDWILELKVDQSKTGKEIEDWVNEMTQVKIIETLELWKKRFEQFLELRQDGQLSKTMQMVQDQPVCI